MRKPLKKMNGERKTFVGTFEQYGAKKYSVSYQRTALLKNIVDINGKKISDHAWITGTDDFNSLNKGDVIQFSAKIKEYVKGYWDIRKGIDIIKSFEKDYKFDEPTKVRILKEVEKNEN